MRSWMLVLVAVVGCVSEHAVEGDLTALVAAPVDLRVGADVSRLTEDERVVFWRAAQALNAGLGREVFAPEAPAHVLVLSSRDCDLQGNTGWATRDYDAAGLPVLGTADMCLNFMWLLGNGAWAADRVIGHELLHSLGVQHDHDDPDSLMAPGTNVLAAGAVRPHHLSAVERALDER
jgi:hypothetical protein